MNELIAMTANDLLKRIQDLEAAIAHTLRHAGDNDLDYYEVVFSCLDDVMTSPFTAPDERPEVNYRTLGNIEQIQPTTGYWPVLAQTTKGWQVTLNEAEDTTMPAFRSEVYDSPIEAIQVAFVWASSQL